MVSANPSTTPATWAVVPSRWGACAGTFEEAVRQALYWSPVKMQNLQDRYKYRDHVPKNIVQGLVMMMMMC